MVYRASSTQSSRSNPSRPASIIGALLLLNYADAIEPNIENRLTEGRLIRYPLIQNESREN